MKAAARNLAMVWLASVLLAGCALLPQSPEETLGAGYVTVAALADTAAARVAAGSLSVDTAQRMSERLKEITRGLDTATAALAAGNEQTANESLAAAIALLTALETELRE